MRRLLPLAFGGMRGLDTDAAFQLRSRIANELMRAARANAGHATVEPMLALLDAVDRRLDQLAERPSLERRQRVADRGPSRRPSKARV